MSVDSGFAPNPYYGYCTLAACTPNHMRANLVPGDIIAGVESDSLIRRRRQLLGPDTTEARCLIYYLPIAEVLDLDSYFRDPRFTRKKPEPGSRSFARRTGDNVYFEDGRRGLRSLPGNSHDNPEQRHQDIRGNRVYISAKDEFFYFGDAEVPLPQPFERYLPKGHGIRYHRQRLPALDRYVHEASERVGVTGRIGQPIGRTLEANCTRPSIGSCAGVKSTTC
ncbi:Nmad2 family putative nucleotide modification protein [Lentisalinibacter salinarum]|uniref:Nmad2 family putative nucleotide modification protein n=1 Tax=Lentisalinibacter salinarum TaxID=2992239 RepID=UPI00386D53A5